MRTTHRPFLFAVLCAGLVLVAGCFGNDDDSPGTTYGSNPELVPIENQIAEGVGSSMVGFVKEAVENFEQWGDGFAISREEGQATWNAADQAWTLSGGEEYSDGDADGVVSITWWVQFRAGGVPQQEPNDNTDQIEIRANATNSGNYHPEEHDWNLDFDWTASHTVTGTRNPDESADFVGSGSLQGTTATHLNDQIHDHVQNVTWSHDFNAGPQEACWTGSLTGTMDIYDFSAVFDAEGTVDYTISANDVVIHSETDEYTCGAPQ